MLHGRAGRLAGDVPRAEVVRLEAVVGDEDQLSPPQDAEALAEGAQNAPFVGLHTIPGAGHLAPLEAPGDAAVAFADLVVRAGG